MKQIREAHCLRKLIAFFHEAVVRGNIPPAACAIDVVIPVVEKDLPVLPLVIQGLRKNVSHPIAAIYVVAPHVDNIMRFCETDRDITFVDEKSVLGFGPRDINLAAGNPPRDRSGWLFQQLLKLSGKIGTAEHFLTIDADHVLLRPHTFIARDGSPVMYRSKESHAPYYDNIERLTGKRPVFWLSYVSHKMVFSRTELFSLHDMLESLHPGRKWYEAIIESIDRSEISGFSEFELYASFIKSKHSLPFGNHHLGKTHLVPYETLVDRYGHRYRAVTFPDYL